MVALRLLWILRILVYHLGVSSLLYHPCQSHRRDNQYQEEHSIYFDELSVARGVVVYCSHSEGHPKRIRSSTMA